MISICFFIFLNYLFKRTKYYKQMMDDCDRLKKYNTSFDVISIGSGPSLYGLVFDMIGVNGINLGEMPQDVYYGCKLLERFYDCLKGKFVIYTVMSPLFFGNNEDVQSKHYSDHYYYIFDRLDVLGHSFVKAFAAKYGLPLLMNFRYVKKIWHDTDYKQINIDSSLNSELLEEDAKRINAIWCNEFGLSDLFDSSQGASHQTSFMERTKILNDSINEVKKNGGIPIILIPPVSPEIKKYISDEFVDEFVYKNLIRLKENVPILDLFRTDLFSNDDFCQSMFLNRNGAKKMSKIVATFISDMKGD